MKQAPLPIPTVQLASSLCGSKSSLSVWDMPDHSIEKAHLNGWAEFDMYMKFNDVTYNKICMQAEYVGVDELERLQMLVYAKSIELEQLRKATLQTR